MQDLLNQLITVSVGLGLLGGSWALWFLTGVANNMFNDKKWSWKRMGEDLLKTLLMAMATLGWTALCYGVEWFAGKCGCDIKALMDGASVAGVIGAIIGGTIFYAVKGYKNIINFVNANHVEVQTGEIDYKGIADEVREGLDTLLGKSVKEQLEEEGIDTTEIDGEIIEPGKGGVANTYPEPYRSAEQDTILDPSSCFNRECCSYTAWKIAELKGSWMSRTGSMNAKEWVYRLPEHGYKEVAAPRDGGKYIGVSQLGTYGHVVNWEGGNTISEYNYATRGGFGMRNINLAIMRWFEIEAPQSPKPTPEPTPAKADFKIGDIVKPTKLVDYNGTKLKQYDETYVIMQLVGDRAVLGAVRGQKRVVWAALNTANIKLA